MSLSDSQPGDERLPVPLAAELRAMHESRAHVPPELDVAILASARLAIARRSRGRRLSRWVVSAAGATAAAAMVAIGLWWGGGQSADHRSTNRAVSLGDDLDGSGRVDILDAFYLAKRIDDPKPQRSWDLNGDGRIDGADVDAIAAAAVRVGGGGAS